MEFEKLQRIIGEVLERNPEDITEDMTFIQDLGADSLDVFQIIMGIEDTFDVIIEDEAVGKVKRVKDVLNYLHT